MTDNAYKVSKFRGLNNVTDPLRLNMSWLTQADNVDITDRQQLVRCRGFTQRLALTNVTGAYASKDLRRLYVVDNGRLLELSSGYSYRVLRTGLSALRTNFSEVAGKIFYTNGTDFGLLTADGDRPWGIQNPAAPLVELGTGALPAGTYQIVCTYVDSDGMESGNSSVVPIRLAAAGGLIISHIPQSATYTTSVYVTKTDGTVFFMLKEDAGATYTYGGGSLGVELPFWNTSPPRGHLPVEFAGRMYCGEWFPSLDLSVIWRSLPMHYHHFDLSGEAIAVPGEIRMLAATPDDKALILGTERAIHAYDGENVVELAPYGTVPGDHASALEGKLYWWSNRGVCQAMPFVNLTEKTVSVAPGLSAGATVIEKDGIRRYVVALQSGGTAYNSRS